MGWPSQLYELTARDIQSVRWEPILLADDDAVAAGAINIDFPAVPIDKFRWITSVMVNAGTGTNESITNVSVQLRFFSGANARIFRLLDRELANAPFFSAELFPNHAPWPPGWNMRVRVNFSPGTNVNSVQAAVGAIQTPRGNVAL